MDNAIRHMLETIEQEARATAAETGRPRFSPAVMEAMAAVNRADFVPETAQAQAFANGPLPIGFGQTISQPFIVALMTDSLDLEPQHRVLEIGTGSGYQAAVLSKLAAKVFSMERVKSLAEEACERLARLGYNNIECRQGNGYLGWPEQAPFDRIIVTAAAPSIPSALLQQLIPGGKLVLPLGETARYQELLKISKDDNGHTDITPLLGVSFVPLVND